MDAKGRVTGGTTLVSGDIPAHTHVAIDIVSGALPFTIQKAGTAIGTRRALNLIEGANITLTVADDSGNDRANVTVAAASGASTHNLLSATHPDTVAAAPVLGDRVAANGTPAWARLAGNATATWKFLRQTGTSTVSALPAWDTLLAGDLPAHTHAESDVTSLATDLTNRPVKGGAWPVSKAAVINSSGQLDGAAGTATDCVLVNGTGAAKANVAHTHAATDIVSGTLDNARTSGTASATASTLVLRNGSDGASFGYLAANNQPAYLGSHFQSFECGAFQTVGGAFENMAKYSEDFTVAAWDKNGGSCSVTANSTAAPDGNTTADTITAVTATPIIQQQVAGLVSGGQYTFYVWAKITSGTKQVSIAIVDNAYAGYLAGPTSITLTTAWQRFKITGTLAGGQTGLWIVVRQFAGTRGSLLNAAFRFQLPDPFQELFHFRLGGHSLQHFLQHLVGILDGGHGVPMLLRRLHSGEKVAQAFDRRGLTDLGGGERMPAQAHRQPEDGPAHRINLPARVGTIPVLIPPELRQHQPLRPALWTLHRIAHRLAPLLFHFRRCMQGAAAGAKCRIRREPHPPVVLI